MFGASAHRKTLLNGLQRAASSLRAAGCSALFVDGSFVTAKAIPGDFDACWDPRGVDPSMLDPVLLDFTNKRINQKIKYGGELFPSSWVAKGPSRTFLEFFQLDDNTGKAKGIVMLDLQTLP